VNCPYCAAPGTRMETHAHLGQLHGQQVRMFRDDEKDQLRFTLDCPFCDEGMERVVNPRGREPGFLEEFRSEITLVAFDLLLYHLHAAHAEQVGLPPIEGDGIEGSVTEQGTSSATSKGAS
jgi:hypothetical protein